MIGDRAVVPAGLVTKRAGDPGFADTGRTDDQQVLFAADPIACGQLLEQRAIETAGRTQIDRPRRRLPGAGQRTVGA